MIYAEIFVTVKCGVVRDGCYHLKPHSLGEAVLETVSLLFIFYIALCNIKIV
ncbi:hypothetical protein YC2023_106997 [Brassica napus]